MKLRYHKTHKDNVHATITTLQEAFISTHSSVASEKRSNNTGREVCKAKLARYATITNFVEIALSTLPLSERIYSDRRDLLASKVLETIQKSFKLACRRCSYCDMGTNIVKSELIRGESVFALEIYDEQNEAGDLKNPT